VEDPVFEILTVLVFDEDAERLFDVLALGVRDGEEDLLREELFVTAEELDGDGVLVVVRVIV